MSFPWKLPFLLDGPAAAESTADDMPTDCRCAESWVCGHPEQMSRMQTGLLHAGAQAIFAPTLFANAFFLSEHGLESQVARINGALIAETRKNAAPFGVPVGGCIGPSGLFVQPYGRADFDDIYDAYREQVRALAESGADFLMLEAQTSLADMRAAVLAARTTDLPVFVTLSVDDGGHTMTGCTLLSAAITLQAMGVEAVGLTAPGGPGALLPLLRDVLPHASVPLIARPDPAGLSEPEFAAEMRSLLTEGISVAGCGRPAEPGYVSALRRVMDEFSPSSPAPDYEDADCYAAAIEGEAFFLGDDILFSRPIPCTSDLMEDLIGAEDEQVNAALVEVNTLDDAMLLSETSTMARLPIAVRTDSHTILDAALRYFQGRLIVDSNCQLDRELIDRLAAKYGAIVY